MTKFVALGIAAVGFLFIVIALRTDRMIFRVCGGLLIGFAIGEFFKQ